MYEKGLGCKVDVPKVKDCKDETFSPFEEKETENCDSTPSIIL